MLKPEQIKPINGYVLIKPDPHYETYQFKGRETGILSSNLSYVEHQGEQRIALVKERNYSIRGTVFAVPDMIKVPDDKFHKLETGVVKEGQNKGMVYNFSVSDSFRNYSEKVNLYNTEMELEVGDRVLMSWTIHNKSEPVQTTEGEMLFVKYDQLVMVVDEDRSPKKMLNGWVLLTKDENEEVKKDEGLSYTETKSGLFIPVMNQYNNVKKVGNKNLVCTCHLAGKPNKGYKEQPELIDDDYDISVGEKMIVDRRGLRALENRNHREYETEYYITHRKSIIFTEKTAEKQMVDFKKLIDYEV